MAAVPARRHQQVLPQMPGKILQDRMLLALGIYPPPQMAEQALNGAGHGSGALLGGVLASPCVLAQEFQDLPMLLPRLRLRRLASALVRGRASAPVLAILGNGTRAVGGLPERAELRTCLLSDPGLLIMQ
jgi:hypothetical protein